MACGRRVARGTVKILDLRRRGWFPMPQIGGAILTIEAAQRRIKVDRLALDFVQRIDVARAFIDSADYHFGSAYAGLIVEARRDVDNWVREKIHAHADCIPWVRWPQQRQHKIRALMNAPDIERLPEVAPLALETMPAGEVHTPRQPDGAVRHEAAQRRARALELALQQVIDQDNRFMNIP